MAKESGKVKCKFKKVGFFMAESIWSVLPPVITIVLALATKEVYMSLLVGIFSGALLYTDFAVWCNPCLW